MSRGMKDEQWDEGGMDRQIGRMNGQIDWQNGWTDRLVGWMDRQIGRMDGDRFIEYLPPCNSEFLDKSSQKSNIILE